MEFSYEETVLVGDNGVSFPAREVYANGELLGYYWTGNRGLVVEELGTQDRFTASSRTSAAESLVLRKQQRAGSMFLRLHREVQEALNNGKNVYARVLRQSQRFPEQQQSATVVVADSSVSGHGETVIHTPAGHSYIPLTIWALNREAQQQPEGYE